MGEDVNGTTFYVDFERIKKHDGYVYFWELQDFLKPNEFGILSGKTYNQGDCKKFRSKLLSWSFYKEPMGRGNNTPDKEWRFPSSYETVLKSVCAYAR